MESSSPLLPPPPANMPGLRPYSLLSLSERVVVGRPRVTRIHVSMNVPFAAAMSVRDGRVRLISSSPNFAEGFNN